MTNFSAGDYIYHCKYGKGQIQNVLRDQYSAMADVKFEKEKEIQSIFLSIGECNCGVIKLLEEEASV